MCGRKQHRPHRATSGHSVGARSSADADSRSWPRIIEHAPLRRDARGQGARLRKGLDLAAGRDGCSRAASCGDGGWDRDQTADLVPVAVLRAWFGHRRVANQSPRSSRWWTSSTAGVPGSAHRPTARWATPAHCGWCAAVQVQPMQPATEGLLQCRSAVGHDRPVHRRHPVSRSADDDQAFPTDTLNWITGHRAKPGGRHRPTSREPPTRRKSTARRSRPPCTCTKPAGYSGSRPTFTHGRAHGLARPRAGRGTSI